MRYKPQHPKLNAGCFEPQSILECLPAEAPAQAGGLHAAP
jgi:hypothetical protein